MSQQETITTTTTTAITSKATADQDGTVADQETTTDREAKRAAHRERLWNSSQKILRYINRTHGLAYTLTQRLAGGFQSGAYLLTDNQNNNPHAVLKWDRRQSWADRVTRAAPMVAQARRAGWPTPAWQVVGTSPSEYPYVVQDYVPGAAPSDAHALVTADVAAAALAFTELQRDVHLEGEVDWAAWDRGIVFDADAHATYANTIRAHSVAGAALVEELEEWLEPFRRVELSTTDLVHGDFYTRNLLFAVDECKVIAAIDVEALGKGSRFHDIANLAAHAVLWPGEPEVLPLLKSYAREHAPPGEWDVCVGARLLELLRLSILWDKDNTAAGPALERAMQFVQLVRKGGP